MTDEDGDLIYVWGCVDASETEAVPVVFDDVAVSENDDWVLAETETGESQGGDTLYEFGYYDHTGRSRNILQPKCMSAEPYVKVLP